MKRLALALVCGLLFAGCGNGVQEGVVTSKVHQPESQGVIFIPIQVGNICSGSGTSQICIPQYIQYPYFYTDGEDWVLHVNKDGKEGKVYVSEQKFNATHIGEYISKDQASTKDPSYTEKRKG